jgi:signal peptidase II
MKKSAVLIAVLFVLDAAAKYLALRATGMPVPFYGAHGDLFPSYAKLASIAPCFDIILVWNRGVSFSMLSSSAEAGRWALAVASAAIIAFVVRLLKNERDRRNRLGYSLVIAGALGNLSDRIRYGAVADFLDFYVGAHHWPAFNVADICICAGVFILVLAGARKTSPS